jgi:hypothetical protein
MIAVPFSIGGTPRGAAFHPCYEHLCADPTPPPRISFEDFLVRRLPAIRQRDGSGATRLSRRTCCTLAPPGSAVRDVRRSRRGSRRRAHRGRSGCSLGFAADDARGQRPGELPPGAVTRRRCRGEDERLHRGRSGKFAVALGVAEGQEFHPTVGLAVTGRHPAPRTGPEQNMPAPLPPPVTRTRARSRSRTLPPPWQATAAPCPPDAAACRPRNRAVNPGSCAWQGEGLQQIVLRRPPRPSELVGRMGKYGPQASAL